MMATALEVLGVALIALGVVVTGITVYGVVRIKGLFSRLQVASKASMLGAVAILAGSIGTGDGGTIARAVIAALFLLITTTIAAHIIAMETYRRDRAQLDPDELPAQNASNRERPDQDSNLGPTP